jgi:hypothetical protein
MEGIKKERKRESYIMAKRQCKVVLLCWLPGVLALKPVPNHGMRQVSFQVSTKQKYICILNS